MKKNKKRLIIIVVVVIVVGGGLFFILKNRQTGTSQRALPTFTAQISDLSEKLSLSGTVKTVFLTEVNTKAEGVVRSVYVQNGEQVKQGAKMFEIELSPESKQQAQSAYNSYLNAKNSLESTQASLHAAKVTLFNKNQYFIDHAVEEDLDPNTPAYIMQESDWLNAEANYKASENKITVSQQAVTVAYLNYQQYQSTVTAPTSGEVSGIAVTEGMMISNTDEMSQRLAVIKTGQTLLVQLDVSELDIAKVKVGQEAEITLPATDDQVFTGEVISIDQIGSVNSGSATYPVLVSFTVPEAVTILPNMSADVDLKIEAKEAVLTVSTLAVQKDEEGQYYVNVVSGRGGSKENSGGERVNGQLPTEKRVIEVGTQTENLTEVRSGLNEGEVVQMTNFNKLFETSDTPAMMMMGRPGVGGGMMGAGGTRPAGNAGTGASNTR
jgi:multidrug efflux pump subunit AcrA (membrane-fusion protein)